MNIDLLIFVVKQGANHAKDSQRRNRRRDIPCHQPCNMRMQVFEDEEDYDYFLDLLKTAKKKFPVEIHVYCLMPNHFHLLLVPLEEKSLSRFMQWVMTVLP